MKGTRLTIVLVGIAIALILALAGNVAVLAQSGYWLPWSTEAAGGGSSTSLNYELEGSVEHATGVSASPNYILEGGFWSGVLRLQTEGAGPPPTPAPTPTPIPGVTLWGLTALAVLFLTALLRRVKGLTRQG